MQLVIVAVGHRMPAWVDHAFADYAERLPADTGIELREVRPESRATGKGIAAIMAAEAERIRAALPKRALTVALDEHGRELSSLQLARQLEAWRAIGDDVAFVIGGADGLDTAFKAETAMQIRLSNFTLPHGLVRVILAEQLYRAWSITQKHPYHRS